MKGMATLVPIISLLFFFHSISAQLSTTFYDASCPNASSIIRNSIRRAISRERRMAASTSTTASSRAATPPSSSTRPQSSRARRLPSQMPTLPGATTSLRLPSATSSVYAPGVVSCADILTLAARDASVAVGGPSWNVRLGRRDSTTASRSAANTDLPSPFAGLDALISAFSNKGLNARDMVALSGAHTLGQAQCLVFRGRIYSNGTDIDAGFSSTRRRRCPQSGGDSNLAPLDLVTPNSFDNNYFRNLVQRKGLLQSDQVLLSGSTASIVSDYSRNPRVFAADFANAMIKMSEIQPLLGQNGIIRRVCSVIN